MNATSDGMYKGMNSEQVTVALKGSDYLAEWVRGARLESGVSPVQEEDSTLLHE